MKQGRSINELAAEITRQAERKADFVAPTDKLEVIETVPVVEGIVEDRPRPRQFSVVSDLGSFPLRPLAIDQAAGHLDIPLKYVRKLAEEQPKLLVDNFNTLLHAKPSQRLIRTLDGEARAFLSNRYQRIDNVEVAQVVLEAFSDIKTLQVRSCEVTENRLYIKASRTDLVGEVKSLRGRQVGDIVEAGVMVTNSEVGLGAVSVTDYAYYLWCLNGATRDKGKRWNHVGGKISDGEVAYLSDDTLAAGDKFDLLRIRDALKQAFDAQNFQGYIDKLNGATQRIIQSSHVPQAIEFLGNKLAFSEGEKKSILGHLIEGGDLSQYGLLNAVTRSAQDAESYDRASELEAAGQSVLLLPANDWRQIAEAA